MRKTLCKFFPERRKSRTIESRSSAPPSGPQHSTVGSSSAQETSLQKQPTQCRYQYKAVDDAAREIRLMTLLAGSFEDPIRIVLQNTPFPADESTPPPMFEALSYAWGAPDSPGEILAERNGYPAGSISVTRNLAEALPYLRHTDKDRVLWIDAICVNQSDLDERSSQVQRMGNIYTRAHRVIAWLGLEEDDSARAFDNLSLLGAKIDVNWTTHEICATSEVFNEWADRKNPLPYDYKDWSALYSLYARPWFDRLWIQQEVRLAKEIELICGTSSIRWESFGTAVFAACCKRKAAFSHEFLSQPSIRKRERVVLELIFSHNQHAIAKWPDTLYQTRNCKCSDPKDRIFATLSLVQPTERQKWAFAPDYTQTLGQTYTNASASYMAATSKLDLLRNCDLGRRHPELDAPSWAVDCESLKMLPRRLEGYGAEAGSNGRFRFEEGRVLSAEGVFVDFVETAVCFKFKDDSLFQNVFEDVRHVSRCIFANELSSLDIKALSCVLLAGSFSDSGEPPIVEKPTQATTRKVLERVLAKEADIYVKDFLGEDDTLVLRRVREWCHRRSLISTKSGRLGIAPAATRQGDSVVVLLGCRNPLVVRCVADHSQSFQVVGECFVHSIMNREMLLGPLPEHVDRIAWQTENSSGRVWAFRNNVTGDISMDDLRYDLLLGKGWRLSSKWEAVWRESNYDNEKYWAEARMECMKVRGFELQEFRII